jgi:hypothetical protein
MQRPMADGETSIFTFEPRLDHESGAALRVRGPDRGHKKLFKTWTYRKASSVRSEKLVHTVL